jgi:hypothetical protein
VLDLGFALASLHGGKTRRCVKKMFNSIRLLYQSKKIPS